MDSLIAALIPRMCYPSMHIMLTDQSELMINCALGDIMRVIPNTLLRRQYCLSQLATDARLKDFTLIRHPLRSETRLCLQFTVVTKDYSLTAIRTCEIEGVDYAKALMSLEVMSSPKKDHTPPCVSEAVFHNGQFVAATSITIHGYSSQVWCDMLKLQRKPQWIHTLLISKDWDMHCTIEHQFAKWVDHPKLLPNAVINFVGWSNTPEDHAIQDRICAVLKRERVA